MAVLGILYTTIFYYVNNAHAECVSYIQSQTIAAAYSGDEEPTVHYMDTCSGDDVSYQIPIATTITFDGIEYTDVYATTNSVITFGRPDGTYWDYPQTPSISLYSMDWFAGVGAATEGLNISYSEGGFQLNLQVIPFGNWSAEASNINILVAITNTGGISVAYSYQGPEYSNMRTGVRLHDGSIISLEEWGATQIQPGEDLPELDSNPISEGPTQEEIIQAEEIRITGSIIANSIAMLQGQTITAPEPIETTNPMPETIPEPNPEPEPVEPSKPSEESNEPIVEPNEPIVEPTPEVTPNEDSEEVIVIIPEIIKPNDPLFPKDIIDTDKPIIINDNQDNVAGIIADLTSKDSFLKMTYDQKIEVSQTLGISMSDLQTIQNNIDSNPELAMAVKEFADRLESNSIDVLPYTLADVTTEIQIEQFMSDPLGTIFDINPAELLSNFSELGMDMTDDQRKKAQEVIIPVIIASQIIGAFAGRIK